MSQIYADEKPEKDWHVSTTLGNSVGIGTFVAGYAQQPSWTTSLSLGPSYQLPAFWGIPRINLSANQVLNFWWLNSYKTSIVDSQNRVSLNDLSLTTSMAKIINAETVGFSLGTDVTFLFPTSLVSQKTNRIFSVGAGIPLKWSKWGFNAGWTPSVNSWLHSSPVISVPCFEMSQTVINPQSIDSDVSQAMQGLAIVRNSDERIGDGECIVSGRQTVASINNFFSLGWSNKEHSVGLGLGWFINFLRPLENSTSQGFTEATLGKVAYTYNLPIETDLSLSAGVISIQSSYTKSGDLAFPLFDFLTPGNNQTQIFMQATIGI